MISADELSMTMHHYFSRFPGEVSALDPARTALSYWEQTSAANPCSRNTLPGHFTCSAIIVCSDSQVLHIRHRSLGTWLRPGGHIEPQDNSLIGAAQREASEETGIPVTNLILALDSPLDIDIHDIPENPAKPEPAHQHYDLRYLFQLSGNHEISLQLEEVDDYAWIPSTEIQPTKLAHKIAAARQSSTPSSGNGVVIVDC